MKNIASIKNLFLLLLITATLSCNSDDSSDDVIEEEILVLKRITSNRDIRTEFNDSGRFILSIAKENTINESKFEQTLNTNNQLVKKKLRNGRLIDDTEYQYDGSGRITQTKRTTGDDFFTEEIITEFSYGDNTITATNEQSNENFQYIFTFTDNSYNEIIGFKATNLTSGEDIFEETYLYYTNGNFKETNIITSTNEQSPSAFKTYEYDDTRNPWADGNRIDYLNDLFLATRKNIGSLSTTLVIHSKNNRLTSHVENSVITVEYNEQGYISKETETPDSGSSSFGPSIINFEYY